MAAAAAADEDENDRGGGVMKSSSNGDSSSSDGKVSVAMAEAAGGGNGVSSGALFCSGASVRLVGLQARPDLNGHLAVCLAWSSSAGRWMVSAKSLDEKALVRALLSFMCLLLFIRCRYTHVSSFSNAPSLHYYQITFLVRTFHLILS